MAKTTFWNIILQTIEKDGTPLSAKEIWDKSEKLGTRGDFKTTAKKPWQIIASMCYTEMIKNGDDSEITQPNKRPAQFFLRKLKLDIQKTQKQKDIDVVTPNEKAENEKLERALHPVLVAYAMGDMHFKAHIKTIFHEKSSKGFKGYNEWLHPDLVGVYFPFNEYKPETTEIQKQLSRSSVKLFSFELKISLVMGTLRKDFFQAVSNSSWANEGYLVALNISDDSEFKDELRRLNNAFGIGIIKLNPENVAESEILFPSRINQEIDWDTVNRLAEENLDFKEFLILISEDCNNKKVKSQYDKVYNTEDLTKHITEKGIKNAHLI